MVFFRSYFHVFGLLLVFLVCGFSFADKTQHTEDPFPVLNLKNFAAVEMPDKFSVLDNFSWGAKALFSHADAKTIVPVFAYNLADVCGINFLKIGMPRLFFHFEMSDGNLRGTAVWGNSLKEFCFASDELVQNESGELLDGISWNVGDSMQKWETVAAAIADDLALENSGDFILTIYDIKKIKPVRDYWLMCNTKQKPSPKNSICYATLKASPYKQHKDLTR